MLWICACRHAVFYEKFSQNMATTRECPYEVKTKRAKLRCLLLSFTSPGKEFFINIYEVFTSPEKGKRSTYHC